MNIKPSIRVVVGLEPGQDTPRVLVAEDLKENRDLLTKLLRTVGFDVREAVNGMEAVRIFEQWQPHFIWMDIRMPIMDGLEATRLIKSTDAGRTTKVVALTAHALNEEKERILEAGCNDFVRKPYREDEIFEVMKKQLGLKYVYLDEKRIEKPALTVSEFEQVKTLPEEILLELYNATLKLDIDHVSLIIEQIINKNTSIGSILKIITQNMDYSRLLTLLDEVRRMKEENKP